MPPAHVTNPPTYTDPSAADDISSLIGTALVVQEGLFNAREGLKRVNGAGAKELLPQLADMDERYLRLLNESRTAATNLSSAIQDFIDVTIPISQDTAYSLEDRVAIVKGSADKIATSAQQDLQPYDKQVESLKEDLDKLLVKLVEIETSLKDQSNSTKVEYWLSLDVVTNFIGSVIGWFVAPKAQEKTPVTKAPSEATTSASAAVDEGVLWDISALVVLLSSLIGKLGHFGAVWEKLVSDSVELSAYLSTGTTDQDMIDNRVQAEVGVYENIKQALDDYCLRPI